jgi:hypothetical protein
MAKSRKPGRSSDILLRRVLRSRAYRGKHVILIHGKVYVAASGAKVTRLFDKVVKEFPGETPTLAYIPEADTLVLGACAVLTHSTSD